MTSGTEGSGDGGLGWIMARLPVVEAAIWADALALLVEDGQHDGPVVVLSRVVDRA